MTTADSKGRRGPVALNELVGRLIEPMTARRGFARAELIAAWPEIVGAAHAACTAPDKIVWPRGGSETDGAPGTLVMKVDGPRAIYIQHELPQIIERVNAFFGYAAIGAVRMVQGSIPRRRPAPAPPAPLDAAAEAKLGGRLASVGDEALRAALGRLGRSVLTARRRG